MDESVVMRWLLWANFITQNVWSMFGTRQQVPNVSGPVHAASISQSGQIAVPGAAVATSIIGDKILIVQPLLLVGAPGLTTRSKDATRSKGHRY